MNDSQHTQSVLFVCMGNICRSPTAEAVFTKLVADAGRNDEFVIDSAGTIGYHSGSLADSRMRRVASEYGYQLDSIARRLEDEDYDRFDYIVTMDDENYAVAKAMDQGRRARVVKMCDYCQKHQITEVPDPYYGGEAGFHEVIDILEDACASFLRQF